MSVVKVGVTREDRAVEVSPFRDGDFPKVCLFGEDGFSKCRLSLKISVVKDCLPAKRDLREGGRFRECCVGKVDIPQFGAGQINSGFVPRELVVSLKMLQ